MQSFKITYAAHTNACTFLLDAEGICRRIVPNPSLGKTQKGREAAAAANRCIGAQYVASLDATLPGILSEMPRVGIPMVFARIDSRGRIALVRTGVVTRFENSHGENPFGDRAPSISVETSAPPIPPGKPANEEPFGRGRPSDPDISDDITLERENAPRHRHEVKYRDPAVVFDLQSTIRRPPKTARAAGMLSPDDAPIGRRSSGR